MSNYGSLGGYGGKAVLPLQASFGGSATEHFINYENRQMTGHNSYVRQSGYGGKEHYAQYANLSAYAGNQRREDYAQEYRGASGNNKFATLKGYNKEHFAQQEFDLPEYFEQELESFEEPEYFEQKEFDLPEQFKHRKSAAKHGPRLKGPRPNARAKLAIAKAAAVADAAATSGEEAAAEVAEYFEQGIDLPEHFEQELEFFEEPEFFDNESLEEFKQRKAGAKGRKGGKGGKGGKCSCKQCTLACAKGAANGRRSCNCKKCSRKCGPARKLNRMMKLGKHPKLPAAAIAASEAPSLPAAVAAAANAVQNAGAETADVVATAVEAVAPEATAAAVEAAVAEYFDLPVEYFNMLGFVGQQPPQFPNPQPPRISNGPYVVPAYPSKISLNYAR